MNLKQAILKEYLELKKASYKEKELHLINEKMQALKDKLDAPWALQESPTGPPGQICVLNSVDVWYVPHGNVYIVKRKNHHTASTHKCIDLEQVVRSIVNNLDDDKIIEIGKSLDRKENNEEDSKTD